MISGLARNKFRNTRILAGHQAIATQTQTHTQTHTRTEAWATTRAVGSASNVASGVNRGKTSGSEISTPKTTHKHQLNLSSPTTQPTDVWLPDRPVSPGFLVT